MYPSVVELNAKISTYLYLNLLKDKREGYFEFSFTYNQSGKIRIHLKFDTSFISIED
jgi:hypothetical protein